MTFWQKISPRYTPPSIAAKGDLIVLRERILQIILIIFSVLGGPAIFFSTLEEGTKTGDYRLMVFFGALYLLAVAFVFFRDVPYAIRAHTLVTLVYLLAVSQVFEKGELGDTRLFLLVFITLSAVLFNFRETAVMIILSIATLWGIGLYATFTPNPIFPVLTNLREDANWFTASITLLMISLVLSGAISVIISGLEGNLKKQADLTQNLANERDALEGRIQERTESITRRMVQLRTAADISRTISALSDPEVLLQQVVDLIRERFNLYYVGIFLLDEARENAVLRAGTGEAGKRMIAQAHQLSVGGSSMIGWSISNRRPRIALDVGAEAVRFSNPHLPLTRSELALPIVVHDLALGAITVQSENPHAFDENDIAILENVADSLGIALENDQLYHQTRENLEEIRALNREYLQRVWAETIETYGELNYDYTSAGAGEDRGWANMMKMPLVLRDEVIGEIVLEMERDKLSEDELAFVNNVTTQTAIALENARLLQETERRAIQEQKLNELASRFSRAISIDEILRAAAQELGQLPAVADVSVQLNPVAPPSEPIAPPSRTSSGNGKERSA